MNTQNPTGQVSPFTVVSSTPSPAVPSDSDNSSLDCSQLYAQLTAVKSSLIAYAAELAGLLSAAGQEAYWTSGSRSMLAKIEVADTLAGLVRVINAFGSITHADIANDLESYRRLMRHANRLASEGSDAQLLKTVAGKLLTKRSAGTLASLLKALEEIDSSFKPRPVAK